jgi:hypothetical protein
MATREIAEQLRPIIRETLSASGADGGDGVVCFPLPGVNTTQTLDTVLRSLGSALGKPPLLSNHPRSKCSLFQCTALQYALRQ